MPVEIRAATPADLPAILTLAAEAKALLKARNITNGKTTTRNRKFLSKTCAPEPVL